MKYCRFQTDSGPQYGEIVDRNGRLWIERLLPPPEEDAWTKLAAAFTPLPLDQATLLPPVVPSKILCIGRNYKEHAAELGNEVPKEPLLFLKTPSSLIAHKQAIHKPAISQRVDFEGELAIVIGKKCSKIGPDEDVRSYIRGYTIVNDVTARDLQKTDGQWSRAKGFDTFCPTGPLVTDEIDPDAGTQVQTHLNGELRQDGTTRDLIFPIAFLLRHITAAITLYPGDLIPTGTPSGVGPMQPGDTVEVTIGGIGTLSNPVIVG
ncbi:MAG: fumarylacetoacetate hydrolase family protein [Alloacidobacterium sp.]|jgi:2-keto-4-pentenoate hydratase/2-oxohepta-3-ene-1,7-dioic acid hydratase in catechol pathway